MFHELFKFKANKQKNKKCELPTQLYVLSDFRNPQSTLKHHNAHIIQSKYICKEQTNKKSAAFSFHFFFLHFSVRSANNNLFMNLPLWWQCSQTHIWRNAKSELSTCTYFYLIFCLIWRKKLSSCWCGDNYTYKRVANGC